MKAMRRGSSFLPLCIIASYLIFTKITSAWSLGGSSTRPSSLARPVQLIAPADAERTSLVALEEGLKAIETLEGPIAVVAVVGPYHSGKSFLLNNIARSLSNYTMSSSASEKGQEGNATSSTTGESSPESLAQVFQVGRTVDPSTAGIWAFHQKVKLPGEDKPMDLLLFDTEGFAVANVTESYDAKIFAAATVLSSLLIYNSMHLIDAKELEYLDLLAHNTQLFSLKTATKAGQEKSSTSTTTAAATNTTGSQGGECFSLHDVFELPPLIWSIQAFTLDLNGETCTSWLKRLLSGSVINTADSTAIQHHGPLKGSAPTSQRQRLGLDGLFPSVNCQTFWLPATSRNDLHNLGSVAPSHLTPEFVSDVETIRDSVFASLRPKTQSGRPLTGPGLAALVRLIVDGLNKGELWDIPSRWASFSDHLRVSSVRAAITHFETEVINAFRNITLPLPASTLGAFMRNTRQEALVLVPRLLAGLDKNTVVKGAVNDVDEFIQELRYKLSHENAEYIKKHLRAMKDEAVAADHQDVEAFIGKELPMTTPRIKAWAKSREDRVVKAYADAQAPYKDDSNFAKARADFAAKASAHSDRAMKANTASMEAVLRSMESTCLERYKELMEETLGEAPVLESRVDDMHKPAAENTTHCLGTGASTFVAEGQFKTRAASLTKGIAAHLKQVKVLNTKRLDERCHEARNALLANASHVVRHVATSIKEPEVEAALTELKDIRDSFKQAVSPLGTAPECRGHEKILGVEMDEIMESTRQQLAVNLKEILVEPLQEICKVVVEAKCPSLTSVSSMTSLVDKECRKWILRNHIGQDLSFNMIKRVLGVFVNTDLADCREQVRTKEKLRYKQNISILFSAAACVVIPLGVFALGRSAKALK